MDVHLARVVDVMFPVVDILGVAVELRTPLRFDDAVLRLLGDLPSGGGMARDRVLTLESAGGSGLVLVENGVVLLEEVAEDAAVATLVWRLNAIAAECTSHLIIHAGAVASDAGGMVLPGRSGAGKSWLTAACVEDGFDYLSDEHAALDLESGLLNPLPKPLDLGAQGLTPASQLRPGSVGSTLPPSAVVFPRYSPGVATSVTRLEAAEALLALCANCTNLASLGGVGFRWLAGLATTCQTWQVSYSDAADAAGALRRLTGHGLEHGPARPAEATAPITADTSTVVVDDGVVVFDARTMASHHLNRSAGLVWLCAAGATDRNALENVVLAEAPPGAIHPQDIQATIDHLCSVGLLSVA